MPFANHATYKTPPDDTTLWRYSDFAKFMDLIERRKLWFCRADKFEDPLEGTFTDAELAHFQTLGPDGKPAYPSLYSLPEVSDMMRGSTYVNCWRAGEYESMAMWDIYGKGSGVVAIKTTVGLLKESLASCKADVYISRVKYMPWDKRAFGGNAMEMCIRKDASYEHESEVRAVMWALGIQRGSAPLVVLKPGEGLESIPGGQDVDVDPARLITEVIVGPREQSRILNLVEAIMKRYGLPQTVRASDRLRARKKLED